MRVILLNMLTKIKGAVIILLRSSERYAKTDMVYLTKGMSWITLGQGVVSAASLITAVAFANLLPPEVYGEYRYVLSILNLLAVPTLLGLNTALMRSAAQGMDRSLLSIFQTRLSWGLWGMGVGFVIALYYLIQGNISLASSFSVIATFVPLFYSFETFTAFLKGKRYFKTSTIFTVIALSVSSISLITALFLTDTIFLLLLSYFLPYTVLRGIFFYITYKKYVVNQESDPHAVSYGKHLSVMSALSTLAGELDKLLLWHFIGPVQLAVYSLAIAPVKQIGSVKSGLELVAFPKIAEQEITYVKSVMYGKIFRLFLVMAVVVAIYIAGAPFLYDLVFPRYAESVLYSQIFVLTLLFAPFDLIDTAFSAHGKVREQYYMSALTSIGKIILFALLVPLYGIWGVISGYLTVNVIRVGVRIILFNRL